jgi:RimJ/RimL family protein N-acetyltransferase
VNDYRSEDSQDKVLMRPVKISDSQQLLEWRNHTSVRRYSRHSEEITLSNHQAWFANKLELVNDGSKILMFSNLDIDIGMTRLDLLDDGMAEISILVEPTLQHKGLGSKILQQTINYAFDGLNYTGLRANIHIENLSSAQLFSKFGFARVSRDGLFNTFLLRKSN